ncbi:MAG: hypothetical protein ACJ749_01845 [Flavisolibacter sp.]
MKSTFLLVLLFLCIMVHAKERKTVYYSSGRVQYEYETEGYFFDGKFSSYYETGRLRMKGQFSSNQKTGVWRVWDEKGLLRSERNYRDNDNFTIVSETDSSGMKVRQNVDMSQVISLKTDFSDYLFKHSFLSSIERTEPANSELFASAGLIDELFEKLTSGTVQAFSEYRFVTPLNKKSFSSYKSADIVALLVKEDYYCTFSKPTMSNNVIGICPVVMENGKRKELGWLYVPDLNFKADLFEKIRKHLYPSLILKTTINDPAFKLHDVDSRDNELARLMLTEFEANIILYAIDRQSVANL